MSQGLADSLRPENCIVVGNCYQLAPWAMALCAQDHSWWRKHHDAREFAGRKFSANRIDGVEQMRCDGLLGTHSNSGALALIVAWLIFKATDIELHGFDMQGTHYFGPYQDLRNTSPDRFNEFQKQFAQIGVRLGNKGVRVVNRTPGSALRCFPFE